MNEELTLNILDAISILDEACRDNDSLTIRYSNGSRLSRDVYIGFTEVLLEDTGYHDLDCMYL